MNSPATSGESPSQICGIVMPISEIDGCGEAHWLEVKDLISQAISDAGLLPRLVSEADDVGVIHSRIVRNLYENPIVVCDVSGRNPNVMFELGMRLAFDRPAVIIKDDQTPYSFDTGLVEHIAYPRDLRYSKINTFREMLRDKIKATLANSLSDKNYSMFLGKVGAAVTAGSVTAAKDDKVLTELTAIRRQLGATHKVVAYDGASTLCARGTGLDGDMATKIFDRLTKIGITNFSATFVGEEHVHFNFPIKTTFPQEFLRSLADEFKINIRLNPGDGASMMRNLKGSQSLAKNDTINLRGGI